MQHHRNLDDAQSVTTVGYYATPVALVLGIAGICLADVPQQTRFICVGLMAFSAFFNFVFPSFFREQEKHKRPANALVRIYINMFVNILLVYFLGESFHSLWLILALTPFASAVYGTRRRTLYKSLGISAILLVLYAVREETSAIGWGEQVTQAVFIVLMSLLINAVAADRHLEKAAAR